MAVAICLATTQTAAKYGLPHVVDVGVADSIVERGLKNTFRFGPGFKVCTEVGLENLRALNAQAGNPAKTVMIIHEESLFGTGTAQILLARELPGIRLRGQGSHEAREPHARLQQHRVADEVGQSRHRDPGQLLQRIRAAGAHHAGSRRSGRRRSTRCWAARRRASSSSRSFRRRRNGIIDCNHWFNPKDPRVAPLRKRVEAAGPVLHLRECSAPTQR